MNKGSSRLVWIVLVILVLISGFGCFSDKAFKSGDSYICDEGKGFVAEFYESVDIAILTTPGKRFYLHRVPSASEGRYSDGNATLWIKGQIAFVEIDGQAEFRNCKAKPK